MPELPLVEMRKIKGRDNEFEFAKGIFAEVFEHLKVRQSTNCLLSHRLQWELFVSGCFKFYICFEKTTRLTMGCQRFKWELEWYD